MHGLWDYWPRFIDVTVPVEAGRKIDGIRCRRCRYPQPEEIEVRNGLALTTLARTLVDLAGIVDLAALRKAVGRAAIRRKLDLQAVDLAIYNAKGRRGLKALELALVPYRTKDGKPPDVRSDFETLILPELLDRGMPRPDCNAPIHVDGQRFLADFLWEGARVIVETDGRETHETPPAFQGDRRPRPVPRRCRLPGHAHHLASDPRRTLRRPRADRARRQSSATPLSSARLR
ncbi:MAG TPA: hypothetical protein VIV13_00695 [Solirubrobacterales bacterium]